MKYSRAKLNFYAIFQSKSMSNLWMQKGFQGVDLIPLHHPHLSMNSRN
jgi:hypothetical protein